jgi:hypothetical protein
MSTIYRAQLSKQSDDDTTIINSIDVGDKTILFRFQWAIVSEEQYSIVLNYIDTKRKSDPLNIDGAYTYDYDYMQYYLNLALMTEEELNDWLGTNPVLPSSIQNMQRTSQLLALRRRINECIALKPVLDQYKEIVKWQFHATYQDQITVGYIEPGGWYRSQDPEFSFRFISDLDYIGKDDFNNVIVEFEVRDA